MIVRKLESVHSPSSKNFSRWKPGRSSSSRTSSPNERLMDRRVSLGQDVNTRIKSSAAARLMDKSSRWFMAPFSSIEEVCRQSAANRSRRTFFKKPFSIKCWMNHFTLLSITSKDLKWIVLVNSILLKLCLVTWFLFGRSSQMVRNEFWNSLKQFVENLKNFSCYRHVPILATLPRETRWNDFPVTWTWSGTAKCRRLTLTNSFFSIARIADFTVLVCVFGRGFWN